MYAHNMSITAQVVFKDTLSRDIYDIIGVYSGNEIRGVAQIEHIAAVDKYVAFITVYSNQASGEKLTFHLWDASAGKEYAFFGSDYNFTSNSSLGTVSMPLIIRPGWNWIAHLNQKIIDLNETLEQFSATSGTRIKSQTEFADFFVATQTWEGSLKKMVPGQGYLLKSGQNANFQYPVLGKPAFLYPAIPEWEIDINAFEYTMSITSVVEFDAKEMEDSTLIIGAFSGYECRGLTQIQYVPGLNKYVGFLPVYANKASGDSINFKVFEPESGKKREITEKISFISDKRVGDLNAPFVLTAQPIGDELVPYQYYLRENYPNPFNPETIIEYGLSVDGDVELFVFNVLGQKVATLVNERQEAHRYKITFNASEFKLASGIYFYQIRSGSFIKSRKLLFLK